MIRGLHIKSKVSVTGLAIITAFLATASIAQVTGNLGLLGYDDGFKLARSADELVADLTGEPDTRPGLSKWRQVKSLTTRALRKEPLAASAIRNYALSLDAEGDRAMARNTMLVSLDLTRRDLATQFWLIQDFGQKNDLTSVLRHIDQSLRTKEAARTQLIPALHAAMINPELIGPMIAMLKSRPPWQQQFWTGIEKYPKSLNNLADVLIGLSRGNAQIDPFIPRAIINQLAYEGGFAKARDVYSQVYGAANLPEKGQFVNNSKFRRDDRGTIFDWQTEQSSGLDAYIDTRAGALFVSSDSDVASLAASQTIVLPAGSYSFFAAVENNSEIDNGRAVIELVCAEKERASDAPLVRTEFGDKSPLTKFAVPNGSCRFFTVRIIVLPSESGSSSGIVISNISIRSLNLIQ